MTRKIRGSGVLLCAAALVGGCSLPSVKVEHLDDIPEAAIAQLDAMPVLQDDGTPRQPIGDVEGVSCRRAYKGMPASWEDAVRRTKYRALEKGGDAIAELSCERPKGRSLSTMCLESIRCTARAVRIGK